MFLRNLLGTNNEAKGDIKAAPPSGMQTMGASLQRKFAKGVHYNSMYKLVIACAYNFVLFDESL